MYERVRLEDKRPALSEVLDCFDAPVLRCTLEGFVKATLLSGSLLHALL